ncbi:CHAT domain-containing protein [Nocardioides islandensis]|uniref:CHAT domain-containing protein n=1 Tax=Nocardioides islandensis TaxID=433663 RepID=A0A930YHV2_9ACTN|nr:CHAT domain-containing protein [Nocardioides islandensis]MBF4763334.1 CHAT domain-containing protein [Nocardioides islandensis]
MDEATRAAIEAVEPAIETAPAFSDDDLDRARAAAADLRAHGDDSMVDPADLAALSPDEAGSLAQDLADSGQSVALEHVVEATSPQRYPLMALLRMARALPPELYAHDMMIQGVALASRLRMRSLLDDLEANPDPELDALMAKVATVRTSLAAGPPYRWWHDPETAMAEPPDEGRGAGPDDGTEPDAVRGPDASTSRKAYPRLEVTGTPRPDVVVLDQAFQVVLGLQQRRDAQLVASSPLAFDAGETVELDVVLLYDPASFEVTGTPRAHLTVTDLDPYPSTTFTCTARYGEELSPERRLGLQLHRDGQVVGVAWRTVVVVDTADRVADAVVPDRRDVDLLDLDPLVGGDAPDLVVSVCRSDAGSTTFVWTAYAADPAVPVPDLPSASTLDADVAGFATMIRRTIEFSGGAADDYYSLAGRAVQIGRAVPTAIQEAVRHVAEQAGRTTAPAVLLLTEELVVPWELATFDPKLATTWGGPSPFMGAHVAVSRWPLDEHKPRPRPRSTVAIRQAAVLTADYTGVPSWKRLDSALEEADEVAKLFDPPATPVQPELLTVIDLFNSRPEYDVLHAALHGKFDDQGGQEGIVLLKKSPAGGATAQFLTPTMLEAGSLAHGPFVFLNACQVASDESVLGDYAGFASTLMRIGAGGVVAPLWNVRDEVAAAVAKDFYAATLGPDAVPAAEAMRAIRATYTEAAARADDPHQHATLIAYQVFGHPRLHLSTT